MTSVWLVVSARFSIMHFYHFMCGTNVILTQSNLVNGEVTVDCLLLCHNNLRNKYSCNKGGLQKWHQNVRNMFKIIGQIDASKFMHTLNNEKPT